MWLKSLKKHNNMLSSMAKLSGSRGELKNIKKIHARASNKYRLDPLAAIDILVILITPYLVTVSGAK